MQHPSLHQTNTLISLTCSHRSCFFMDLHAPSAQHTVVHFKCLLHTEHPSSPHPTVGIPHQPQSATSRLRLARWGCQPCVPAPATQPPPCWPGSGCLLQHAWHRQQRRQLSWRLQTSDLRRLLPPCSMLGEGRGSVTRADEETRRIDTTSSCPGNNICSRIEANIDQVGAVHCTDASISLAANTA